MNEESKSAENIEITDAEEESVLNRPRPKLSIAKEKNQRPETPQPKPQTQKETEKEKVEITKQEQVAEKVDIVKEKVLKAVDITKKKIDQTLVGGTSLKTAAKAIFSNGKLTVASLTVVLAMVLITIFSYHFVSSWIDSLTAPFFDKDPITEGFFDYIYYFGWLLTRLVFKGIAALIVFYISFIFSYTLTSPLYSFISILAEDIYFGRPDDDSDFSFETIVEDILQALKISGTVLLCTIFVFFINFVPVIGQITAIAFYIVINALMLVDFPASRRNWDLKTKTLWIRENIVTTLRIGSVPTLISMIPLANNIILAFLFPLFVVHSTINFSQIEKNKTAGQDK